MARVTTFQFSRVSDDDELSEKRKAFLAFLDVSATPHTVYPENGGVAVDVENMGDMFLQLSSMLVDLQQQGVSLSRDFDEGGKGQIKVKVQPR